jgi:hypothetical protein
MWAACIYSGGLELRYLQAAAGYGLSASAAAGGGQLSAAARFVLQQMSHDGAQLELVMQHESNFSVQVSQHCVLGSESMSWFGVFEHRP